MNTSLLKGPHFEASLSSELPEYTGSYFGLSTYRVCGERMNEV